MADATTKTRPTHPRPDDEPREPTRFLGLSMTQLSGSALAAVTSAVAASFLGVGGTLIGAAFGSVVSTVAGAAYASSLQTAAGRVRTVVVRPGRDGVRGASQDDPGRVPSGIGADQVPVADVLLAATDAAAPPGEGPRRSRRGIRWAPVAAVAGLGFVIGVGVLTLTEGLLGHPVSDGGGSGTTVGRVVDAQPAADPTPSPAPTDAATATPTEGAATGTVGPTGPATSPTDVATSAGAPSGPTDSASVTPPTDAPTSAAPTGVPTGGAVPATP
ncbi:MAG: hypothetical protein ACKVZ6_16440 [Kineosporiaceae bacterium]